MYDLADMRIKFQVQQGAKYGNQNSEPANNSSS